MKVRTRRTSTLARHERHDRHECPSCIAVLVVSLCLLTIAPLYAADSSRVTRDLQALYTFEAGSGGTVRDRSGASPPLDLKIEKPSAVQWKNGALVVRSATKIQSAQPAKKIVDAVKRTNSVTVEAWIKPQALRQTGPARIVSLSADPNQRNLTLGQDGERYDVRLRTTSTSANGIPSTAAPNNSVKTVLTHVVFTRDANGHARVYINGKESAKKRIEGKLSGWSDKFRLALANELTGNRPWLGELHLLAIYSRALNANEVRQNFAAGSKPVPAAAVVARASSSRRVSAGLTALYTFEAGHGDTVRDRSGASPPLDLKIDRPSAVQWKNGALVVRSATKIQSAQPAKKIVDAVKRTNSVTLEAWIKPHSLRQSGPARIVSLSADPNQRNLTLGQDGERYDVRLRTTSTSANGIPSTAAPNNSVKTVLTHVVFTRDTNGHARVYINGKESAKKRVAGKLSGWSGEFRLGLANELTGDRPWMGELHVVAVYSRALTANEVAQNFKAGVTGGSDPRAAETLVFARASRTFETKVAPLLARKCLECHDSASKKGQLDLSRKAAAFAGGDSGKAIVPGKSAESLLWEQIDSDDMPAEGEPLSQREKTLLKQWIDDGAVWSNDVIDPAIYANDGHGGDVWIQRLTVDEYIETVRVAVGVDIAKEARELLPPDLRADGFSNTAYNLNVDLKHVEAYARLAEIIVARMDVPKFAARFSKARSLNTDATARKFVEAMGKWLCRGPLERREEVNYSGIATTVASAGGSYEQGVALIIEAMLQSPRFIYRIEQQRGDGTDWPVSDYELASRLSYIIWGGPPDADLMRAADAGELSDRDRCAAQVRRMLKDPRVIERSLQFISDWLNLDRLSNMRPNAKRFPTWEPALGADMREETLAFFKDIVWTQNRPLADLLNAQLTYATPRLAKHYGLKPRGSGLSRYDVSKVAARGGLLTQGSVLTIGGDDASMVTRGLFVLKDVLRGTVGDPPAGLDTTPVPSKPGLSQRIIAEKRIGNVSCGGCHVKFEPLAFGLEKFDGLGAYHEKDEHANQLRADGEILFPGAAEPVKYKSSAELMDLLAGSDRVRETITWKVAQFALGRPLGAADAGTIRRIHEAAQKDGGTYSALITAIVMSDLVQMTRTEKSE